MNNPRRIQRHLVRAAAAGALLAAAALPLAIATSAGAVTAPALTALAFTPSGATTSTVAPGASGTVAITGTNFINDGGTDAVTAVGSGVTFTSVAVTSTTTATADYAVSGSATAGTYDAEISFDAGGTTVSLTDALTVSAAVAVTAVAPSPIYENTGANTVTITGSNFETGATITFTSAVDGTTITSSVTSVSSDGTSIVASVTPTNTKSGGAATVGDYNVTVANPDGGSATGADVFAVTNGIQEVSPSSFAGSVAPSTDTIVLSGSDLEPGATVTITGCAQIDSSTIDLVSATGNTATVSFTETGTAIQACTVNYANPSVGGDGVPYPSVAGALSIGEASSVAPIVTAATAPTTPVNVGTSGTLVTLTGTGFGYYTQLQSLSTGITFNAATPSTTGTTISAPVNVASSGVSAGPTDVEAANDSVGNGDNVSTPFATAFTVAGPQITSTTPAAIATGTAYGTTIAVTGTGFTPTTTGTITDANGLSGIASYVSATSMTVTITHASSAADTATISLQQSTATGTVNTSFTLPVDAAPTVSGVTYPTGISDVGVGATAATVYINSLTSGFATGATVTKFVNAAGTADPNVTATVTKVTPNQITATIAVTAPDTNATVGYTVTNTDGGSVSVLATQVGAITLGAGPTITSISPTTGAAGATTAFTVTGTGFQTGAVVTLSPANGTCGTATVAASDLSLTVSCTLGSPSAVATDLVVTNPDGGSATGATPVLAAAAVKAAFKVGAVHGSAVSGKTVTLTISGTGFYGQPKITSTAVGSKIGVAKDTGKLLTVRVTTKKGVAGEHTFTVRLADGKSGKTNYSIKK